MPISNFSLGEARFKADTISDAKKVAQENYGFKKVINITKMWVRAGKPLGPKSLRAFEVDLLLTRKKWRRQGVGFGFLISVAPKIHNRKIVSIRKDFPKLKRAEMKRIYELRLTSDDTLVGQAKTFYQTKTLGRKLSKKYKDGVYGTIVYRPVQPNQKVIEFEYIEAKGDYIVFGCIENKSELKELKINV